MNPQAPAARILATKKRKGISVDTLRILFLFAAKSALASMPWFFR
jgi:hypothetical protein